MDELKYNNNWNYDEYSVGKKRVKKLRSVRINGQVFPVTSRDVRIDYRDHGHPCTSVSLHHFITVKVAGITFEKNLNTMHEHKVYALDWE